MNTESSKAPQRAVLQFLVPLLLYAGAAGLLQIGGIDRLVSDFFFDPSSGSFPARDAWWAENLLHRGGINLIGLIAVLALSLPLAARRWSRLAPYRADAVYLLLCIALTTGLAGGFKRVTAMDCPWDLQRYGGAMPELSLFEPRPALLPAARGCFPGAHSSGAFSLFAFYFLLRRRRSPRAQRALMLAAGLGLLYAATQWVRGAHVPSHDLASALLAWNVALGLDLLRSWRWRTRPLALLLLALVAQPGEAQEPAAPPPPVREITFEGNQVTEPVVMRREMQIHEGEPADEARIERSRQAVQDLGLFRSVEVRREPVEDGLRLVFVVKEKWYLLAYPRLSANGDGQNSLGMELRWNNLWGLNHSLRAIARSRDARDTGRGRELSYRLGYQAPFVFGSDYGLGFNLAHATTPVTMPGVYDEIIDTAEVLLSRRIFDDGSPASQGWMLGGGFLWSQQTTAGPDAPPPYGSAVALVSTLSYRDVRLKVFSDEGTRFNTRFEIADRNAGSDYSYSRVTAEYQKSLPIGTLAHQTLEFGAQLGSANNGPPDLNDFSVGGSNGLRGYPRKFAEGDFYYLASVQYLRPLHWDWLRLVAGVEVGNAHAAGDLINEEPRASLNLGLRLRLPRFVNFEFEAGVALPLVGGDGSARFYGDRPDF